MLQHRPRQDDGRVHGVIVGLCRPDGRWLMIRRSPHVAAPGKVCFPGGAIEEGEGREAAAAREVREEVGLVVRSIQWVWYQEVEDRPLTLWGYLGQTDGFDAVGHPHEVADLLWLTEAEIRRHPDLLGRTTDFLDHLVAARRRLSQDPARAADEISASAAE